MEHVQQLLVVDTLDAVEGKLTEEADEASLDELFGLVQGDPLMQPSLALLSVDEHVLILLVAFLLLLLVVGTLPAYLCLVVLLDVFL